MSPVGGVGISLAIQDAVAAANALYPALRANAAPLVTLRGIERRRMFPTVIIQAAQVAIQNRILQRILQSTRPMRAPLTIRLFDRVRPLRFLPAYLVGIGPRPEHVRTPERV